VNKKILCFNVYFLILVSITYAQPEILNIASLEYPPFIYTDGNEVKGPIADKVKEIFQRMDIEINIEIYPITRGLYMVDSGEVDAFFSLKRTKDREKKLLFTTEPLIVQSFVFFKNKESMIMWDGDIDNVTKYKIGIVRNTSYGEIFDSSIKNKIIIAIEESESFEINFKKLIAGRIDLLINSYDVGLYLIEKLDAKDKIIALEPPVEIINSYLAFTKARDYTAVAKLYDEILKEINNEK